MNFSSFIEWVFLGIISGGVYMLWGMKASLDRINEKLAGIMEKTIWHEKTLSQHEGKFTSHDDRLRNLENIYRSGH